MSLAFLEVRAVAAVLALIFEAVMLADRVAAFTQPLAVAAGVALPFVLAVDGTAALPGYMGGKVVKKGRCNKGGVAFRLLASHRFV